MIEILNRQDRYRVDRRTFERLLEKLVDYFGLGDADLVLAFVDNRTIKKLNREFLNKDAPTDVLSFPIGENGPDGRYYLGDIIISVPRAFEQCFPREHGLERELEILTVHGFLHLLGFDHSAGIEEEEDKIRNLLFKD